MSQEDAGPEEPDKQSDSTSKRTTSTIKFPYVGLDEVSFIAEKIFQTYSGRCSVVQIASTLDQKATSGAFRVKITAAKMFGVLTGRGDNLALTDLGAALVDPQRRRKARVDAFLNVPLYRAMFEEASTRSGMMPTDLRAVEQMIVRLGVVEGQAETARLAFARSARFAGFNEHGADRLVMPALGASPELDPEPEPEAKSAPPSPGADLPGKPTILVEVFKRLPDEGEPFSKADREMWTGMLEAILNVLYPDSTQPPQPAGNSSWTE